MNGLNMYVDIILLSLHINGIENKREDNNNIIPNRDSLYMSKDNTIIANAKKMAIDTRSIPLRDIIFLLSF